MSQPAEVPPSHLSNGDMPTRARLTKVHPGHPMRISDRGALSETDMIPSNVAKGKRVCIHMEMIIKREREIYIYMIIYAHHPPMTRSLGFLSLSLGIGVQVWTCECCMCHSKKTPERQVSYRIDSDSDRNRNVLTLYWKYCHRHWLLLAFWCAWWWVQ